MNRRRRTLVVLAAAALPLGLIASPAHAAPVASKRQPPPTEFVNGTLLRLKTNSNKIVLTDGTVLRYDKNDLILAQHLFDVEEAPAPFFHCDLADSGGEELAALFASTGLVVSVSYLDLPKQRDVSSFIFSINTCDGVVDAADVGP